MPQFCRKNSVNWTFYLDSTKEFYSKFISRKIICMARNFFYMYWFDLFSVRMDDWMFHLEPLQFQAHPLSPHLLLQVYIQFKVFKFDTRCLSFPIHTNTCELNDLVDFLDTVQDFTIRNPLNLGLPKCTSGDPLLRYA